MKKHISQQGSAHVVVVLCLVLALITALGWIFYQNFIYKEEPKKETELITVDKAGDAPVENDNSAVKEGDDEGTSLGTTQAYTHTYQKDAFSFKYPSTGWKEMDLKDESAQGGIVSQDYKNEHLAYDLPTRGARIAVRIDKKSSSFSKPKTSDAHGISNIQTLEVDGRKAYYYQLAYEGSYYRVIFQSNNYDYTIELTAEGDATRAQKDIFNQVWKSFDVK